MTDEELIARLRKRADEERDVQRNNETVAAALMGQRLLFDQGIRSKANRFAVRLALEHENCAKNDAKLARDWDAAANRIEALVKDRATPLSAALAVPEVRKKPGRIVGDFACAAIDFIETMQEHGFTTAAGQSDDDDLDFSIGVYRGNELVGTASFHMDRTLACYLEIGDKTFRFGSIPWFSIPDDLKAALRAVEGQP